MSEKKDIPENPIACSPGDGVVGSAAPEELSDPLRVVIAAVRETLNCDAVMLYTYDDDRKDFEYPPEMVGVRDEASVAELGRVTDESLIRKLIGVEGLSVAPDMPNDPLPGKAFARREGIASSVATRLTASGRPVGVMFVNFRSPHEFTEHELMSIDLFAKQAAVAIRSKQLYEQQKTRAERLQILHEASRDITGSLDLEEILGRISLHAWRLASSGRNPANSVDVMLVEGAKVRLAASYPPGQAEKVHSGLGEEVDLGVGVHGRVGVVGRAIRAGQPQLVGNVLADPDYIGLDERTRSQIVVLIGKDEKAIGVISAEHPDFDAFDEETIQTMELLAAQAGIAIENAKHFDELTKAKSRVDAQTSLALMGMASSIWRHSISGQASFIRYGVDLLRNELPADLSPQARDRLDEIRKMARSILEHPVAIPLSPETAEPLPINDWISQRLESLQRHPPYQSIEFRTELSVGDPLWVRIHKEWLRTVFDIIVDNAARAMAERPVKGLVVTSGVRDGWVEIKLADTGSGIPPEEFPLLMQSRIIKSQEKGLGMGLLMAQTILNAYGGGIQVSKTSPDGTTMMIRLPLAN